jgi:hypothetical protein
MSLPQVTPGLRLFSQETTVPNPASSESSTSPRAPSRLSLSRATTGIEPREGSMDGLQVKVQATDMQVNLEIR